MSEGSFHIVTDGGCDLPSAMGIEPVVVPLRLAFGAKEYRSDELSPSEFYALLADDPSHPTTSQPPPEAFVERYRELTDKPVLSLHISSGLSGTINSARQARREVPEADVHLHDTKTLSAAQAFQVYAACEAARRGESLEAAREWVAQVQRDTELLFTIDTLEYLRRGGRIGRVQAALGSLLDLKPLVRVEKEEGTYVSVGRARTFAKARAALVRQVESFVPPGTPLRVAVPYGDRPDEAEDLLDALSSTYPLHWRATVPVGPTLAVHTGPRALGLCFAPGPWPWEA